MALIADNNEITIPEMAEPINITGKGVEYHLAILNHIERIGPLQGGRWKIKRQN